ncbi:MAG TPA: vitamin K epoxide reductase family protein [Gemmatimonadaceae bacterium]|nr:vitamin K epoxide reductase family protein [Gemmatimonadaceae bacterium]
MNRRMLTALIALVGLLIAAYLTLYKVGVIGTLACGTGSCETVQLSKWGTFLGLPVAAWGVGFYALILALALAGMQERWEHSRGLLLTQLLVTGWGALFSAWLTYLELGVIRAICRYCVVSASLAVVLFVLALLEWRAVRASDADATDA